MSFKTMDGVEVYDKHDIDLIKDSIDTTTSQHSTDINQLKNKTNSLENSKANITQVQELANELTVTKQSLTSAESNISEHSNRLTKLENNSATVEQLNKGLNDKASKAYAEQTRQVANNNHSAITELQDRASALEQSKLNVSDLPQAVSDAVDSIINSKLALVESDINHIVDNAIDDELEDYDNKAAVDQKITTAIAAAVATRPTAMSTAEATAIVDHYF